MIKHIAFLCFTAFLFLPNPLQAQYIALKKGDKVEIRDIKGSYVASAYYSNLNAVTQGSDIVVLWYTSGKVEVRDYSLKYIASQYYTGISAIGATQDYVILYFANGKTEVRSKELSYVSSWYF